MTWWPPKAIHFTVRQTKWLLEYYPSLCDGNWPPESSGYTDTSGKKWRRRGPFESAIEVVAELDERMRRVGPDSTILRDIYCLGLSVHKAAWLRGISERTLSRRAHDALHLMKKKQYGGGYRVPKP